MGDEFDFEDEFPLGPTGGLCIPAIAATGWLLAAVFGGVAEAMSHSTFIRFLGQVLGGSMGCFAAATMHKEETQNDLCRFSRVMLGAVGGAGAAWVALPPVDLEIVVHAALTSLGASLVALYTDPDIVSGNFTVSEVLGMPASTPSGNGAQSGALTGCQELSIGAD